MLVDNTCIITSKIEDIAGTEFDKQLPKVHLGKLYVVNSHLNEQLGMMKEPLGLVLAPADDTLSTSGRAWKVSRIVFHLWMS